MCNVKMGVPKECTFLPNDLPENLPRSGFGVTLYLARVCGSGIRESNSSHSLGKAARYIKKAYFFILLGKKQTFCTILPEFLPETIDLLVY